MTEIPIRKIRKKGVHNDTLSNFNIWKLSNLLDIKDLHEPLHRHNFYFLLAFESGVGTHEIDFITYDVSNNTVFLVRPGQIHRLVIKQKSEGFILQFDKDVFSTQGNNIDKHLQTVFRQNLFSLNQQEFSEFNQSLELIYKECTLKKINYNKIISAHLDILITLLSRRLETKSNNLENNFAQQKLLEFQGLLDIRISKLKSVEKYATLLNMTIYQLNATTKKLLGKTPSEMINECIILEAKRQLLATTNQVSQIAFDLSYEDVSYFIRFFKKQTGNTPDAFRKKFN